jgi:hypothetical protein
VPFTIESIHTRFQDGFGAAGAFWRENIEIVSPAVRFAIVFEEAFPSKLLATMGAHEMVRVPGLVQGFDAFLQEIN